MGDEQTQTQWLREQVARFTPEQRRASAEMGAAGDLNEGYIVELIEAAGELLVAYANVDEALDIEATEVLRLREGIVALDQRMSGAMEQLQAEVGDQPLTYDSIRLLGKRSGVGLARDYLRPLLTDIASTEGSEHDIQRWREHYEHCPYADQSWFLPEGAIDVVEVQAEIAREELERSGQRHDDVKGSN